MIGRTKRKQHPDKDACPWAEQHISRRKRIQGSSQMCFSIWGKGRGGTMPVSLPVHALHFLRIGNIIFMHFALSLLGSTC